MERKVLFFIIAIFTLVLACGVFWLLKGGATDEVVIEPEEPVRNRLEEQPAPEDLFAAKTDRELVVPEQANPLDAGAIPESYRKALGVIKGRVVESSASPVPDITVEIFGINPLDFFNDAGSLLEDDPPALEFKTGKTRTQDDGTFRLVDVNPRAFHALAIDMGGPRCTSRILDAIPGPGETVDLGDIMLAPYAVLMGKVVDDEGEPVQGARVRTTQLPPIIFTSGIQDFREGSSFLIRGGDDQRVIEAPRVFKQFFRMLPVPTTLSAADGSFKLEGVPLGLMTLVADSLRYITAQKGPVSTARGGEIDVGEILLDRGLTLKGKVQDSQGKPLPAVEVRVGTLYGITEMVILHPPITTDEEGVFTFEGLPSRSTFAVAQRFPGDPWTVAGPFDPELEPPVLILPPTYNLRLLVSKEDGTLAKGVRLKIREDLPFEFMPALNPPKTAVERIKQPEDGVLEIEGLTPGKYELLLTARGCGVTRESVTIREEALEKEVILNPAYNAEVRVLTEKKKTPVEWAEVYATHDDEDRFFNFTRLSRSRTDPSGLATLKNLIPGSYRVTASHPLYAVTTASIEVPIREEQVIFVRKGGGLEGVVHRGGSVHEAPYMISVDHDGEPDVLEAQMPRLTATDHEGRFKIKNLNAGIWNVHVLKRLLDQDPLGVTEVMRLGPLMSSEAQVWAEETSYLEINLDSLDLGPCGMLSGRVFLDRAPAEGALLSLRAKKRFEARVDTNGFYDFGKIPEGEHTLSLSQLPGVMSGYDISLRRRVEITPNLPLYEDFDIYTGSISGMVVRSDTGSPVRGIRVAANLDDEEAPYTVRMNTVTGLDGKFRLEGVPVGVYSVEAMDSDFGSKPVTGVKVFPGGGGGNIFLSLFARVVVKGRVELPESIRGARWMGLVCEPVEGQGGSSAWVRLDRDTGEFETKRLLPGLYKARLFGGNIETFKPMEFEVPPGGTDRLVLVPEKADTDVTITVEED